MQQYRERFQQLWRRLIDQSEVDQSEVDQAPDHGSTVFDELAAYYRETYRFYHNFSHIMHCLAVFDEFRGVAEIPDEVEMALWAHDLIYDTRSQDNEAASAQWIGQRLQQDGVDKACISRIESHILATRHRQPPNSADAALVVDIDLSILGENDSAFRAYDQAIRREYVWVPGFVYKKKRRAVLKGFYNAVHIYHHQALQDRYEAPARRNLAGCLGKS